MTQDLGGNSRSTSLRSPEPVPVSALPGDYQGRMALAIRRVETALNEADFDGAGHVITSDNMKLSDVRLLVQFAKEHSA